ncbi:MAG: hypothetical protein U0457_06675 [Candidatus Sericytochromatia bacterium]
MIKKTYLFSIIFLLPVIIACSKENNEIDVSTLDNPIAEIQDLSSGSTLTLQGGLNKYSIFFPLKVMNNKVNRNTGLVINFDYKKIEIKKSISLSKGNSVSLDYFPLKGNYIANQRPEDMKFLTYSSNYKNGSGNIEFDEFNPTIGGKVKGKITDAILYGFYTKFQERVSANGKLDNPIEDPNPEILLKIKKLEFDATFVRSIYG